jgi:glycogen debranching enzyme
LCSSSVVVTGNAGGGIHHRLLANFEGDWRAQPAWRTSCIVLQLRTHDVLAVALTIPVCGLLDDDGALGNALSAIGLSTLMVNHGRCSMAAPSHITLPGYFSRTAYSRRKAAIVPERILGLTISRWIAGGVHEDIEITNNSMKRVSFQLEIAVRSDFADLFEVKSNRIVRRGRIATEWSQPRQRLRTTYRNGDFHRAIALSSARSSAKAAYANGRLSFEVDLQPGGRWHACLLYTLEDGAARFSPPRGCIDQSGKSQHGEMMAEWLQTVAKIQTSNEEFYRMLRRALEDMAALRLPIEVADRKAFMPAAGLPWFVAPFGRDALIVSLQNILIYPHFARGALEFLGSLQATADDPYRDAEPGKILHELRRGELAHFKLVPHTPYYGTADATPLYLITLHAAWRATGDKTALRNAYCGLTNMAIATVMASRNTKRGRPSMHRETSHGSMRRLSTRDDAHCRLFHT